jgi:hypothetical protein
MLLLAIYTAGFSTNALQNHLLLFIIHIAHCAVLKPKSKHIPLYKIFESVGSIFDNIKKILNLGILAEYHIHTPTKTTEFKNNKHSVAGPPSPGCASVCIIPS